MKSFAHRFSNNNSFHLRFLLYAIITLTVLGVSVNYGFAAEDDETAVVSIFTTSYSVSGLQSVANTRFGLQD